MKRILIITAAMFVAGAAQALEVDREVLPRVTLGGRVIATLDAVDMDSDPARESSINSEDSEIALRLDKRLYEGGVAGAKLGFREDADQVHFADHYVFYWNPDVEMLLGHAPLRNTLVEFPVLRDDDLLYASHVANASSAQNFDQTHGDVASIDWFPGRGSHALGVSISSRVDDGDDGVSGIDSAGVSYVYAPPETLRYLVRLRHAGIMLDRQRTRVADAKQAMNAWIAGASVNLNEDPTSNWSLDAQMIRNAGADAEASLATHEERARSASRALVLALRHTGRPALLTRWQAALTVAAKRYDDVDDSLQWSLVPSLTYRIGQGVDVLAQYAHTRFGDALGGGTDRVLQLGLAFSLEATFNDNIGERDSILNREHGYIR